MRLLKFRGLTIDNGAKLKLKPMWVYGDVFRKMEGSGYFIRSFLTISGTGGIDDPADPPEYEFFNHEVDPETIGQIIGAAYHKNVVPEIYEGDIIKAVNVFEDGDEITGVVVFDEHTFKLARVEQSESAKKHGYIDHVRLWSDGTNDHYSIELLRTGTETITIIGNIHEQ